MLQGDRDLCKPRVLHRKTMGIVVLNEMKLSFIFSVLQGGVALSMSLFFFLVTNRVK